MKKIISLSLVLGLCTIGLVGCIQVVSPTPQQTVPAQGTVVQQTAPVQAQVPQQTVPVQPAQPVQQAVPVQPVQPVQPIQGGYQIPQFNITLEQAKQTVLNACGMAGSTVIFTKQRQDYDDGMPEYEIEFIANNMKYEFEVSGVTGAITKQEIESIFD